MTQANPGFVDRFAEAAAAVGSQWGEQVRPDGDIVLADELVDSFFTPRCLVCGNDTVKPDVVFFGESVPRPLVERCFEVVEAAGALLVLGSSLAVMSGYRFVRRAHQRGVPVAIVTRSADPRRRRGQHPAARPARRHARRARGPPRRVSRTQRVRRGAGRR